MKYTFALFLLCLMAQLSFAQKDTTIIYINKDHKETTKDSAYSYLKFYKQDNDWYGREFYTKGNTIKSEGNYTDSTLTKRTGLYKFYKEDGTLDYTANFIKDTLTERIYYYKNGAKKSSIVYGANHTSTQKGWDENGNEIKDFIVEREARFPGGAQGWQKYLEKNLNAGAPVEAGMAAGSYSVIVSFLVSKYGTISEVKALNDGGNCKSCVRETIRVIANGPNWEPAIQNNETVVFRQKQQITFVVQESGRKKKKNDD